jgi:hypothetical protein
MSNGKKSFVLFSTGTIFVGMIYVSMLLERNNLMEIMGDKSSCQRSWRKFIDLLCSFQ